jgi:PHD/YefM family antitoxin component YafN of YafNO toxin-antitoxin module
MPKVRDKGTTPERQRAQEQMASAIEGAEGIGSQMLASFASWKMPRVRRVTEARNELPKILNAVEDGEIFLVRGPQQREALIMSADLFRELQEAYLKVLGELETKKIVENKEVKSSLDAALDSKDYVTLSEVEERYGSEEDAEEKESD